MEVVQLKVGCYQCDEAGGSSLAVGYETVRRLVRNGAAVTYRLARERRAAPKPRAANIIEADTIQTNHRRLSSTTQPTLPN